MEISIERSGGHQDGIKKRKRVITEARKTQNRIAQQAYRKRQKERSEESRKQNEDARSQVATETRRPLSIRPTPSSSEGSPFHASVSLEIPQTIQDGTFDEFSSLEFDANPHDAEGINHWGPESFQELPDDITAIFEDMIGQLSPPPSTSPTDNAIAKSLNLDQLGLEAYRLGQGLALSPPSCPQGTRTTLTSSTQGSDRLYDNGQAGSLEEAILDDRVGIEDILSAGLEVLLGKTHNPAAITTKYFLPDPYVNTLRFVRLSTFTAYLNNARALGMSISDLFAEQCPSPYYRPVKPHEDVKAIQRSFRNSSIPEHLLPTVPQILYPHHPYLDLLPFPRLRSRAIALSAINPPIFDLRLLKKDVVRDGLVCWRSSEKNGPGHGQPWDMKSWEAAPWFLEKYRLLVGGEDDEVWKLATWWRHLREAGEQYS